jgi:hypothetical protein
VALSARDAKVILMVGSGDKDELKLGRQVRHEALEHSLGSRGGWLGLGTGDGKENSRKDGDRE